jgi:Right handed beta helix region
VEGAVKVALNFGIFLLSLLTALENPARAAGTYSGCAAPPASFTKALTATPTTFASILNTAAGGDVIYLNSGNYGALSISNKKYSQFLTIKAGSGQTPVLSSLTVNSVSHMVFSGLTINGNGVRSKSPNGILVNLSSSNNVVFENNIVESSSGTFPWKAETTNETVVDASIAPSDGISASQDYCVALNSNQIKNVFNGIYVGGDQVGTDGQNYIVADNTIDHFAGDGIDHSATNVIIQGNHITNALDICGSKCIHNDGIQGWNWEDKSGITNKNVVIDSNYIQSQTATNLPLAVALQGIDIFDGFWENVSITNNVVLVSSDTGISIAGVNGLHIINNSVMNIPLNGVSQSLAYWMYSGVTWITAGGTTHEGGTTSSVIVRNNIAPLIAATAATSGNCPITESFCSSTANSNVEQDHNLSLVQTKYTAQNLFVTFNTSTAQYNLELTGTAKTNPAIGTGNSSLMPATDILGHSRSAASPNLGAY